MSFGFKNRLCISKRSINEEQMAELGPELYEEVLRYKTQETNYFPQPIDLSMYREGYLNRAA